MVVAKPLCPIIGSDVAHKLPEERGISYHCVCPYEIFGKSVACKLPLGPAPPITPAAVTAARVSGPGQHGRRRPSKLTACMAVGRQQWLARQ